MRPFCEHRHSQARMKSLYNKIGPCYGIVERHLGKTVDAIITQSILKLPAIANAAVLEYACGSGLLSLKLAPHVGSVTARDQSVGMLSRARKRAEQLGIAVTFGAGNILAPEEQENSYDYAFISFALHLFAPVEQQKILANLGRIARKAVVVIDHSRIWNVGIALLEWIEGSYYGQFIRQDFAAMAQSAGYSGVDEVEIDKSMVLIFSC